MIDNVNVILKFNSLSTSPAVVKEHCIVLVYVFPSCEFSARSVLHCFCLVSAGVCSLQRRPDLVADDAMMVLSKIT